MLLVFTPFIQEYILRNFKAKFDYLNNKKLDDDHYALSAVRDLASKTYINICHYNKKTFKIDEEVKLDLDIKNIQKLLIKIFEINTDNYYRQNKKEFSPDINLDGLVA